MDRTEHAYKRRPSAREASSTSDEVVCRDERGGHRYVSAGRRWVSAFDPQVLAEHLESLTM